MLSVLWRAAISKQPFYSKISLGPHEDKIKKIIFDRECDSTDKYSFVVSKFTDSVVGRTMLDPHKERWYGVNYCRFYLSGYVVYIKVDKRSSPEILKGFEIREDGPLIVVGRDIRKSSEYAVMASVAHNSVK